VPVDDEPEGGALAEAYNRALSLEKAGEPDSAAAAYREVLALDPADHGGAAIRLASMGLAPSPEKAPEAYVETLFDQHAEIFDDVLVGRLGYAVPAQLRQLCVDRGFGPFGRVLDLGCGTGLTGGELRGVAAHLTGVDISEKMVGMAFEREVYDELYVGEALAFLEAGGENERWDLITATDVMPYLGVLSDLFGAMAARLAPAGLIAFSTETLPETMSGGRDYMVGAYRRYAHTEPYVRRLMKENVLRVEAFEPITVRREQGAPVGGHLVIGRKSGAAPT